MIYIYIYILFTMLVHTETFGNEPPGPVNQLSAASDLEDGAVGELAPGDSDVDKAWPTHTSHPFGRDASCGWQRHETYPPP